MKATEQYFPVVLFIMLYKVVLTSESKNESYRALLSSGAMIMLYKVAQVLVFVNELVVPIIITAKTLKVETSVVKFRNNYCHMLSTFCS